MSLPHPSDVAKKILPLASPDFAGTGLIYQSKFDRLVRYKDPGASHDLRLRQSSDQAWRSATVSGACIACGGVAVASAASPGALHDECNNRRPGRPRAARHPADQRLSTAAFGAGRGDQAFGGRHLGPGR